MNVLDDFYAAKVLDPNYCYDESQIYHQLPPTSEHQAYLAYIRSLPINDTPEIFGLHDNANSKRCECDEERRRKARSFLLQLRSHRMKPIER